MSCGIDAITDNYKSSNMYTGTPKGGVPIQSIHIALEIKRHFQVKGM